MASVEAKLNVDDQPACDDLHAVFSHLLPSRKNKATNP
jgi:hypothetical protein